MCLLIDITVERSYCYLSYLMLNCGHFDTLILLGMCQNVFDIFMMLAKAFDSLKQLG